MTQIERVLLALYKARRGLTWGMVSRIKGITWGYAYQFLMLLRRQGYATRFLSAHRGKYKSYRFFITEAGIERLSSSGALQSERK